MLLNHQGGTRAVDRNDAVVAAAIGCCQPTRRQYVGALSCERDSTPRRAPTTDHGAGATTGLIKWLRIWRWGTLAPGTSLSRPLPLPTRQYASCVFAARARRTGNALPPTSDEPRLHTPLSVRAGAGCRAITGRAGTTAGHAT
jgi:hypothetical protein